MMFKLLKIVVVIAVMIFAPMVLSDANVNEDSACYIQSDQQVEAVDVFAFCKDNDQHVLLFYSKPSASIRSISFIFDEIKYKINSYTSKVKVGGVSLNRSLIYIPEDVITKISSEDSFIITINNGKVERMLKLSASQVDSIKIVALIK